jgi:dTDP-glucose 4,6-dehydratase
MEKNGFENVRLFKRNKIIKQKEDKKMRLLITGGAGFIGSNFVRYILKKRPDYIVVNLDLLTYAGNLENLKDVENNPNYEFVKGDITDSELVNELAKDANVIVNFAAESHVDRSIKDPQNFVRTNVVGTYILLEAAKNNGRVRFHHISTDEVFGSLEPNDAPFNERALYDPRSPYSASKAASDHLVRAYHHTYGLPITISNCSNNYGPHQFPEKLIPLAITNIIEGKKVPLYGDGMNIRDWLYVEDHCEAIDLIIHKGKIGKTYCVGGGAEKTNKEVIYKILELMDRGKDVVKFTEDRPGHDRRYAIDFSKIKNELGWEPKITFEEGLAMTVAWYRNNESWWKKVKSGDYQQYYRQNYSERKILKGGKG